MADSINSGGGEDADLSNTVATHYNKMEAGSVAQRVDSRIFYLRNFNNWVKSVLISDGIYMLKRAGVDPRTVNVLDLASGKGGDQLKWKKAGVKHVVFADIAEVSVEHCRSRYADTSHRRSYERGESQTSWTLFTAEFHVADCTKARLRDMYKNPDISFDLVSCQFSLHYAFESMSKARRMLQNAAENLRPGGIFIGTIPNAYEIVRRAREAAAKSGGQIQSFGNDVYNVTFEKPVTASDLVNGNSFPLFGAKYHFNLEGVVDCPEFLVYFPLLEELASEYDLELHSCLPFSDFFIKSVSRNDGRGLIGRMQALEPYPPQSDVTLMSDKSSSYAAAEEWLRTAPLDSSGRRPVVGTLSQEEWEATSLYLTFVFVKKKRHVESPKSESGSSEGAGDSEEPEVESKKARLE